MTRLKEDVLMIVGTLVLGPILIMVGIWLGFWILFLSPFILLAIVIWLLVRHATKQRRETTCNK